MFSAWRIVQSRYVPLDYRGSLEFPGRWNIEYVPVLYAAATYELALLEKRVHIDRYPEPTQYKYSELLLPEESMELFEAPPMLNELANPAWTRRAASTWLSEARSPSIRVPSLVAYPFGQNVLINPSHPAFSQIQIGRQGPVAWDASLF